MTGGMEYFQEKQMEQFERMFELVVESIEPIARIMNTEAGDGFLDLQMLETIVFVAVDEMIFATLRGVAKQNRKELAARITARVTHSAMHYAQKGRRP